MDNSGGLRLPSLTGDAVYPPVAQVMNTDVSHTWGLIQALLSLWYLLAYPASTGGPCFPTEVATLSPLLPDTSRLLSTAVLAVWEQTLN